MRQIRKIPTSHRAIVSHWREHPEPLGRSDDDLLDYISAFTCFACGFDCRPRRPDRHHILPYIFDPSDDPCKLHLLCRRCHRDAPHTDDGRIYWAWFRARPPWMVGYLHGAADAIRRCALTGPEIKTLLDLSPDLIFDAVRGIRFINPYRSSVDTIIGAYVVTLRDRLRAGDLHISETVREDPKPPEEDEEDFDPRRRAMRHAVELLCESEYRGRRAALRWDRDEQAYEAWRLEEDLRDFEDEFPRFRLRLMRKDGIDLIGFVVAFRRALRDWTV